MITAGKIDEATEELKCIAKHNGKKLSDESLKMLETFKNANEKPGIEIVNMRSLFPDHIVITSSVLENIRWYTTYNSDLYFRITYTQNKIRILWPMRARSGLNIYNLPEQIK